MKIGVFGDSFSNLKFEQNPTPTWVDILSKKYDVTNFGLNSSNLYYSIELIKKNYLDYDKIILVVTAPGRLKISKWIPVDNPMYQFIIGLYDPKYLIKKPEDLDQLERSYLEAGNQYFTYLQDDTYDRYIHNLMLKDVKELKPDIILIPAFLNSWFNVNGFGMNNISSKENTAWNLTWKKIIEEKYIDLRNCHMSIENNAIFAEKAEQWINGEPVYIDLNDFVTTTDKDFYLKKI
jgi:hypothetical protein